MEACQQTVLPTGQNFGRKTQKWPYKNLSGRKKTAEFFADFSKNSRKVAELFSVCFSHKSLDYLQK
jgi:hypothetical protein